jgi:hypothetical protein
MAAPISQATLCSGRTSSATSTPPWAGVSSLRGHELDGGQRGQVRRIHPGLVAGHPMPAEGGLGGAAGSDLLAAGAADEPGDAGGRPQGGGGRHQGRRDRPGAGVGWWGRRAGQGRGGRQPGPGGGVQGHALAGVQRLDGRQEMAGLGLSDRARCPGPGATLQAAGVPEPVGGDHVHLGPGDPHRPGRPDRVPGELPAGGDPGQPVADRVAVAAGHRAFRVADAQAGLVGGAGHLDLGGGAGRGDLDRSARSSPGTSRKMPWRRRLPKS